MAGIVASAPLESASWLQNLKYEVLSTGEDLVDFHASKDLVWVRDQALEVISKITTISTFVIYGKKSSAPVDMHSSTRLYAHFSVVLMRKVLKSLENQHSKLVMLFDRALPQEQQGPFNAAVKAELKEANMPFNVFFHPMNSDFNGQIADYVAWAKFRQLERGDDGPWNLLSRALKPTEQDIFDP